MLSNLWISCGTYASIFAALVVLSARIAVQLESFVIINYWLFPSGQRASLLH